MKNYNEELINTQELADKLKISTETIRRWKKEGLPVIQLSERSERFQLSEVIQWRMDVMAAKKNKSKISSAANNGV